MHSMSHASKTDSPFHRGEREVQERLGVGDIEEWARKVVHPYLLSNIVLLYLTALPGNRGARPAETTVGNSTRRTQDH